MIFEKVAETIGAVGMERPEGRGRRKRGEEDEAGTHHNRDLMADTGQRGVEGRAGIWTT